MATSNETVREELCGHWLLNSLAYIYHLGGLLSVRDNI
jgi:hypothetical protein